MAEKAQTEYGGICGRDAFMARVNAFLHANDAARYRAALALRRERKRRHALDFSAASVDE